MKDSYSYLIAKQNKEEIPKWLEVLKRQENATVLFVPKTDRLIRLSQLLRDRDLITKVWGDYNKFKYVQVVFDPEETEVLTDVTTQISNQLNMANISSSPKTFIEWTSYFKKNSMVLIIIIPEAEIYLNPAAKHVLSLISQLSEKYAPLIRILSFFESNFTHPAFLSLMPASTRLYENIFSYPLYTEEDTLKFINLLEKLWDLVLTDKTKRKIMDIGGGHFWLIKQAVREVSSFGEWKVESEGMIFRLRTIFNYFAPNEQSLIRKLITEKKNFDENEIISLKYLKKMRVISENNRVLIEGFNEILLRPQAGMEEIELRENQIFVNQVPVDKLFTKQERRVMKLLLGRSNQIVTRDEISKSMWPFNTNNQYSDWAIDQLIARVRKRLQELSLSPKILESLRGKGYRLKVFQDNI